ncbi:hypothetical protein B0H19DRAFT_1270340 [Mycena capillaripes]|nr:hypothetical protein B0H19DRAFT_1270340 [Mycena capillaripes]
MPRTLPSLTDTGIDSQVFWGLIIPGVSLTTGLLILYGYAAWNLVSRRYLDRVSFRLLFYALLAHLVFGIALPLSPLIGHPGWSCDLLSFIINLTLMFSAGMFFCMALNLPLVLAHNVNGQKMERYYVLGTTLVCLICNVVYLDPDLRWDRWAVNETCWYRSSNPAALHWLIGTQTAWILFTCVGEVGAFVILVGYLIVYEFDTWRFRGETRFTATYTSEASYRAGSAITKFRNIILRIALYPLVACLLNVSTAVLDLHEMKQSARTELTGRLNLVDLAIYAGRPFIYALFAATDPSFIRAVRALRRRKSEAATPAHCTDRNSRAEPCLSTVVEMPPEEVYHGSPELTKDDAREQVQTGTEETCTTLTPDVEDMPGGIGMAATASPIRRPSVVDVVCHI